MKWFVVLAHVVIVLVNGSSMLKQAYSASRSKYTSPDVGTTKHAPKDVGGG